MGEPSEPSGVFSPGHRALSFGIVVSMAAFATEGMAVATVLPTAATELGGLDGYGWAFSTFMLMSLIGAIAAGQSADRGGVTTAARLGFFAFASGLVVAGAAPSWPVLLLGRGLQGFGGGSLSAIAYIAVARGYPEALRPRLLALLSSAWVVPALVGPALAGQVAEHASWRLVFLGILPLLAVGATLLVAALGRLPASSSEQTDRSHGRLVQAVRLAVGVGLLLWAAGWNAFSPAPVALGALGALLAIPALRSLLPPGTFSAEPGLPAAVAIRGLVAFAFFGSEALIPLGLATVRELPPSVVGLALTAGALSWVAGSWFQSRDESRTGGAAGQRALRVRVGLALVLVGIGAVGAVILSEPAPVVLAVVAWGVAGLGMGLAIPGSTLVALGAPSAWAGLAAASLQVADTVGVAAGTGAGGTLIAVAVHLQRGLSDGLGWAFVLMACALVLALAPAVRLVSSATGSVGLGRVLEVPGRIIP